MQKLFKRSLFFVFLLMTFNLSAQISVTTGQTAEELAEFIAGPNITVSGATITGSVDAIGIFTGDDSDVGFDDGVIMSTGDATTAEGPNTTTSNGQNLGTDGTPEMTALIGAESYDAITLEFDFEVQSSMIQFNYVFGSEEYPEFAPPFSSGFNDAFAFYISGDGIDGEENIALVPGTSTIVSSNTINPATNSEYFISNPGGPDVEFDGFTTVLVASKDSLTPCTVYHLKLVIADGQDEDYNSAVFLQENSLVQDLIAVETQTVNEDDIALEGCIKASFTFSYNDISDEDRTLVYQIGGTAVNGVDYAYIDTIMTIPAGDTSAIVFIDAFSDGIAEEEESIFIIYQPDICSENDTTFLFIQDSEPIDYSLSSNDLACFEDGSGEIEITASGGHAPYTFHVIDSAGVEIETADNPVTGLDAGEYTVLVEDSYGCFAEALVVGGVFDADTTFLPDGTGVTYDAPLEISGFDPGQTITSTSQIQQICLTMEHSFLGDLTIEVESPSGEMLTLKGFGGGSCDLGEPFASSAIDGEDSDLTDPGVGYEYCFNAEPIYGTMVAESAAFTHTIPSSTGGTYTDNYLPAGSYAPDGDFSDLVGSDMNGTWIVHVTDNAALDNGYIFNWYISLIGDEPDTTITVNQPEEIVASAYVEGTACGTANGSINLTVESGESPYTYLWSNDETTEDIADLAAGTYTVEITDANGCQISETFAVNNSSSMSLTYTTTAPGCFGESTGSIDITPAGGTPPYTYAWSTSAITEDLTGITAGEYSVSVTDDLGCVFSEVITVEDASELIVNISSFSNEVCNADNGAIDINVIGGSGSYSYAWDNGSTSEDLSELSSGTYTVTVTDAGSCTASVSQSLINDNSDCSAYCYLSVFSESVVDEECGDGNGSIDITVLDGSEPLIYSWSNDEITEDLTGLTSGTYTVTVTDDNNCTVTDTYTINNSTGDFSIGGVILNSENCGNSDGSIDLTVSGGTIPYSYSWSNGETTEDIDGLSAGTYTLTVTDADGCEITEDYTVENNSGSLTVTAVIEDELCVLSDGSIDQTVSGESGSLTYSWESGQITEDITGLSAGEYTCTVTDEVGCYVTNTYEVGQDNQGISISSSIVTNELCGNGEGAINITTTGESLSFSWSNGETTEDISGLSAGDYTCTISNASGCTFESDPISVLNSSGSLLVGTPVVTHEVCTNGEGAIDMSVSNGEMPYTYSWSSGETTEDISGLSAGVYTMLVTDANGCSETHSVTVTNAPGTLDITAVLTNESCGDGMGAINLTTSGGTIPYTYLWSNGETTEDITELAAGTYTVTVSDDASCELTETFELNEGMEPLSITSATVANELCGNESGSISIVIEGGNAPYTYEWDNGASTQNISGLSAGDYTISITDSDDCVTSETYTVTNSPGELSVSSVVTDEYCGDGTGEIDITVEGGDFPMTFEWSSGESVPDISELSGGIYTLTLTDNFGCQLIHSDTVVNNTDGLAVSINTITNDSCGLGSGAIDVLVSGADPLTYLWSNGETTEDISGLSAGSYTITVTNDEGCSVSVTGEVSNESDALEITFENVNDETCENGEGFIDVEVSGAAPFIYDWSNGETTQDITGLSAGTYTLTVTDDNGCQITASYTVENEETSNILTNDLVVSNPLCTAANGSIEYETAGGVMPYTYLWSNGETTEDISDLSADTYTLTITDAVGCIHTDTWVLETEESELAITEVETMEDNCGLGVGSITVTSPAAATWYLDGVENTEFPLNTFNGLSEGTYVVSVSDDFGCTVDSTITVDNVAIFALSHVQVNDSCGLSLGEIDLTVFGPGDVTYSWSNGETTEDLSGLSEGTYEVTVSTELGPGFTCEDTYTVVIENIQPFTVSNVVTNENCGNELGAIDQTLVTDSEITYLWSNDETTEDISGLSAGTYTCIITASEGCADTIDYVVENISGTMESSGLVFNDTCSAGIGMIDLTVSGGSDSYEYVWSNSETTQDINELTMGNYLVTITDNADDCILVDSFQVNNIEVIFSATGEVTDASGPGAADGEIDITITGTDTYTYEWSNGETTEDITGLEGGSYTLDISSSHGCDTTLTFFLNTLSINENELADISMEIYPNPAIDQFTIVYHLPKGMSGDITITDGMGRVVMVNSTSLGSNQLTIDASDMTSGLYFVIFNSNKITSVERLIISD